MARLSLLLLAPCAAAAQATPPTVVWATAAQPFRDNQAPSPPVVFGPMSGGVALAPAWSYSFTSTPPGIFSESVSDTSATYALSGYTRFGLSTISSFDPTTGRKAWTTAVPHAGGFYFAAAGLQLTNAGTLVTHSVSSSWQCVTALNVADGSVAWQLNTSQVFDHVTIDPSGGRLLLTDYFEPPGSNFSAGMMIVDAASGQTTYSAALGFPCVSPIVTLAAIICFCDGAEFATHLCGVSLDLSTVIWKVEAGNSSLGRFYFPSTAMLSWTQIGPVGYGSIVAAVVDPMNVTRLAGFAIDTGVATDCFGDPNAPPGMSAGMPWPSRSGRDDPSAIFLTSISLSNDAATAFVSAVNFTRQQVEELEGACDEAVAHGVAGAPRWATCAAARATAGGRRHRCVLAGDCDLQPGGGLVAAALPPTLPEQLQQQQLQQMQQSLRRRQAAPHRRSALQELGAAGLEVGEGAVPVSRYPFVAVGLGAGNLCFHAYTISRAADPNRGMSNAVLGADGALDPAMGTPWRSVIYIHGNNGQGDQSEAIGWDGQNCTLAGGAGISATIDNGRFMSLGGIDGLVVASGLAFDPNGLLTGSVLTGVIGQAHPGPAPGPPASSASSAPPSIAGPVVGSLFGLGLVAGGAFLAFRNRTALAARWAELSGAQRSKPMLAGEEMIAMAYEASGGATSAAGAGAADYASL